MVWGVVPLSILGSACQAMYKFQESRGGTMSHFGWHENLTNLLGHDHI